METQNHHSKYLSKVIEDLKDSDTLTAATALRQLGELKDKIPMEARKNILNTVLELSCGEDQRIRLSCALALGMLKEATPNEM